ncbi:ester cyclase [Aureimonas sp. AU40]|uniref:ester cyclase n=1 Tax=Aureimonas sp. AU40 TaxID=1637747 RepID=UPI00078542AE|nr:ester cyclase [Aureimonas sp. AU40]
MATQETNKQLARDYFDAFLRRDEAWWQAHIDPGFRRHDPGLPFEVRGPDGVKQLAEALHPGIPDMELPIEDVIAEGEKVLVRLRVKGTHGGELMGLAATGRPIDIGVLDLFEFRQGKLVEHWALLDNLGLLKQLGVSEI